MGFKIMTADGWKEIPTNGIKPSDRVENIQQAESAIMERGNSFMSMENIKPMESARSKRHKERMNEIARLHNTRLHELAIELLERHSA